MPACCPFVIITGVALVHVYARLDTIVNEEIYNCLIDITPIKQFLFGIGTSSNRLKFFVSKKI